MFHNSNSHVQSRDPTGDTRFILSAKKILPNDSANEIILPYSVRHYVNTATVHLNTKYLQLDLDTNFSIDPKYYVRSFYMSQFEVTNLEYKEFVNWVKDSIVRTILAEEYDENFFVWINRNGDSLKTALLNRETQLDYDPEIIAILNEQIYLPQHERFYKRPEIDTRKLDWRCNKGFIEEFDIKVLNVYPDTNCWINDFALTGDMEAMTNMYFWHPAFNHHPVVGINYYQAQAYLNWKTQSMQKELE